MRPCSRSSAAAGRSRSWAKELGVSPQSLLNWANRRDVVEGKADGLSSSEREELRRLRREVKVLAEEREILEKSRGLLRLGEQDPVKVFGFVLARKAEHSIKLMCRVLEVSRSGYHAWAARPLSARGAEDARLSARIGELHALRRGVFGSPRIWVRT